MDDFLLQIILGDIRNGLLAAILETGWKIAKDAMLEVGNPITFLGIDIVKLPNGDLKLYQERFADSLLSKHGMEMAPLSESYKWDRFLHNLMYPL